MNFSKQSGFFAMLRSSEFLIFHKQAGSEIKVKVGSGSGSGKTNFGSTTLVFAAQIVLPNKFLQNDEFSVDTIVKKFSKTLHVSAPFLSRHNSSNDLPSELPAELLSTPLVWVHWGSLVPPLQPLYNGPYVVLRRGPPLLHHQSGVAGQGGCRQPP